MQINGNQIRGHLDTMVLAILEQAPAHGFAILKGIQERGNGMLEMKEGSLYPALYRLESAGFVRGDWEDGSSSRRGARRRYYKLTPKGKRQLERGRNEWTQFVKVVGNVVGVTS